jgi:hypothetical protein
MSVSPPPVNPAAPPPPAPPKPKPPPAPTPPPSGRGFKVSSGVAASAQRIGIYGTGGSGKSSLAAGLSQVGFKPLFLDTEGGSRNLDVDRIGVDEGLDSWTALRAAINSPDLWTNHNVLVLDSVTRAQDWLCQDIMGKDKVDSLELAAGGYGKAYRKMYDSMLMLLSDLEEHLRHGRNVVLVMHELTVKTPNPEGEDYQSYQPNLYASDKVNLRARIKEWCDHLFFVNYDVVSKDGKGKGAGTRTIFTTETPTHWAKTRASDKLPLPVVYPKGGFELWTRLFGEQR